jgi:hypothetical protein
MALIATAAAVVVVAVGAGLSSGWAPGTSTFTPRRKGASQARHRDLRQPVLSRHQQSQFPGVRFALTPQNQQGQTAETFSQGFGSSADSDEILVAINPATNGDTAATLTFTSHQKASQAQGSTGTCTDWNITLFLEPDGTGYLIGDQPSTYHAKYSSCQ